MKKFIESYSCDSNYPSYLIEEGLIDSNNIIRIGGKCSVKDKGVYYKVKLTEKEVNKPLFWTFIGSIITAIFFAIIGVVASNSGNVGSSVMMSLAYITAAMSSIFLFLLIPYGKVNIWTYIKEEDCKELNK